MESSTSRCFPELEAGLAPSSPAGWTRAIQRQRSASRMPRLNCSRLQRKEACSMCSRFLSRAAAACLLFAAFARAGELRVCADPAAMPSSDARKQGYDNRIAEVVAHDLGATLVYKWQRNGRG